MTTNTAKALNMDNKHDREELREELVSLLMACVLLPTSKVRGTAPFAYTTNTGVTVKYGMRVNSERGGLAALYKEKVEEAKSKFYTASDWLDFEESVTAEFMERLQRHNDQEDELFKNEDVDDLTSRFEKIEAEAFQEEYDEMVRVRVAVEATADEAQKRHERMTMRLAIVEKLKADLKDDPDELKAKLEMVNDDLVQRIIDGDWKHEKELQSFVVGRKQFRAKETEILSKDRSAHFKDRLERVARLLRSMSIRAEDMLKDPSFKPVFINKGKKNERRIDFVGQVISEANKWMAQAKKQLALPEFQVVDRMVNGKVTKVKVYRRFSVTSLMALYNECASILNALGVFKDYFPKTMKGFEPSFFMNPTRKGMVEVKSGADWSDELRILFYETEDGTGRVPVRNSGLEF
jgi:hypothetical protein